MKNGGFALIVIGIIAAFSTLAFCATRTNETIETHKALPHNKPVLLDDGHCRYLEDLNRQYAGVTLSAEQQQMRQQLVLWYTQNCRKRK